MTAEANAGLNIVIIYQCRCNSESDIDDGILHDYPLLYKTCAIARSTCADDTDTRGNTRHISCSAVPAVFHAYRLRATGAVNVPHTGQ